MYCIFKTFLHIKQLTKRLQKKIVMLNKAGRTFMLLLIAGWSVSINFGYFSMPSKSSSCMCRNIMKLSHDWHFFLTRLSPLKLCHMSYVSDLGLKFELYVDRCVHCMDFSRWTLQINGKSLFLSKCWAFFCFSIQSQSFMKLMNWVRYF